MSITVNDKNLGHATAYAYAKSKGYTGTEEEFAELMANFAEKAEEAKGYADDAKTYAQQASTSAGDAVTAKNTAVTKANEASQSATNASTSAGNASASANSASASAQTAITKASEAEQSATEASESASTAVSAKDDAVTAKESAETAKTDAETAKTEAEQAAEEATQTVANKADKDGTYPDMSVGNVFSDDSYTEDQTPYLYRVSGGGVEVGKVEEDSIVGGTVAWNQLIYNGNFASDVAWAVLSGATKSIANNEAVLTLNANFAGLQSYGTNAPTGFEYPLDIAGHKYFLSADIKADTQRTTVGFGLSDYASHSQIRKVFTVGTAYASYSFIGTQTEATVANNGGRFMIYDTSGSDGVTLYVRNVMVVDLTQMFGSTIADYIYSLEQSSTGAGVAFFRSLFPKDYYEYNTGELLSVSGIQSHDMVGFNAFDKNAITVGKWFKNEHGEIENSSGSNLSDYIHVIPNTVYYRNMAGSSRSLFYDADKNVIDTGAWAIGNGNGIFTTPANAHYIRLTIKDANLDTFCINLSSDRNGEYEPYIKHSYPLDSSLTLRGIPKVSNGLYFDGDTYEADGTVTRKYGVVDLGTLNYTTWGSSDSRDVFVPSSDIDIAPVTSSDKTLPAICPKFSAKSYNATWAHWDMAYLNNGGKIGFIVPKSTYDRNTFKTAMSGVMLVYELATPTEETAQAYAEYQKVSKYGTEEYVSTSVVPVGHVTKYPTDIVAKVNGLPSNFSTLIAPTEKGFTATRAYTVNDLIIVSNQLYRATTSIASGATLTVGTNVVATTVADILTALLNA